MVHTMKQEPLAQRMGDYLRQTLNRRHMTQETFAALLGVDPRTVRRWIRDGIHCVDTVEQISRVLQVSIGDIFAACENVPLLFSGHTMPSSQGIFFSILEG